MQCLRRAVSALLMLTPLVAGLAQTTGVLEGVVTDPSGLPVEGAQVRVIREETQEERRSVTGPAGRFQVRALVPGAYRAEAEKAGFATVVREGLELGAGRTLPVGFRLRIGEQRQEVVVTGSAAMVSTDSSEGGGLIDRMQLASLPLNGRDMFDLASQYPGVSLTLNGSSTKLFTGIGIKLSLNGARPNQMSFRMDGVYMNDSAGMAPASATGRLLGVEGIQELSVVSSPFSVEYGRAAGSVITAVSRSGGNDVHGSAYWYLRNDALDARNFFDSPDSPAPPLRKNQFGVLVSGPVSRNKIFYLVNYEGLRERRSRTGRAVTLTEDARNGVLPAPGGGTTTIQVADAVKPFLRLYPLPNGLDFGDGSGEFISQLNYTGREDYGATRGDFLFSERTRSSVRFSMNDGDTNEPDALHIWNNPGDARHVYLHSETVYTQSAGIIHTFRAGYSRIYNRQDATLIPEFTSDLAFVPGRSLGTINVTGLSDLTENDARTAPRYSRFQDYQVNYETSLIRGGHTLRFGAGYDRILFGQQSDSVAAGRYRFTSIENFLLAKTRSGEMTDVTSDTIRNWRQHQLFSFAQDEYRPFSRLSVTLGVRYEAYTVPTEIDGKIATLPDPVHDATMTIGGPLFKNPSKNNFAPRVALAWDPTGSGKTVVRAGAGVFFDLLGTREVALAGMRVPPFYSRLIGDRPTFPNLAEAFAGITPELAVDGLSYNLQQPYVVQFQFNVQRQVGNDWLVQLGYAGSRGVHLLGQYIDINVVQPVTRADGRLTFPADASLLNPSFGRIGLRSTDFNSIYHSVTGSVSRRFQHGLRFQANYTFAKLIDDCSSIGFRDFEESSDRFPSPFNRTLQRARADFDVRQVFAANFDWEPSWRTASFWGALVNGWQFHGTAKTQTGYPFSPMTGFDRAEMRSTYRDLDQRPDLAVAPGSKIILGDPQLWFDPNAFVLQEPGVYGNLGRNTLEGPGLVSLSAAAHKDLIRTERHALRLRVEGFNVTNHPNFAVPENRTLFSSNGQRVGSAGRLTATTTPARQLQMALRWEF